MSNGTGPFARFIRKNRHTLFHLVLEEYAGFLTRSLPSIEGVVIRRLVYRGLCKKLGSDALIYPGAYLTHTYGMEIGDRFSINSGAILDGRGGMHIGNSVMVGPHAVLVSSTHEHRNLDLPMSSQDHIMQPLNIKDDVWIGANAFIRGGITIGKHAVVGAGACVLGDVADHEIAGGVPARTIGDRREHPTVNGKKGESKE